ncbi:hypothetical protein B296_00012328 [Ensete ventricosum]|uniref:Uncharacterized protein n=1 Tax=Ensete ventricosum TaxID=4639 RepID=A0A426ZQ26_ENSVE|nr:hypothetical protein B296_00012328 [Ensete ventricosum]
MRFVFHGVRGHSCIVYLLSECVLERVRFFGVQDCRVGRKKRERPYALPAVEKGRTRGAMSLVTGVETCTVSIFGGHEGVDLRLLIGDRVVGICTHSRS